MIYLSFHWQTSESVKAQGIALAERVHAALVKSGMSPQEAQQAVEDLWSGGYSEGRDTADWDASYVL